MYGVFYNINIDYASILWEYFLTFLPTSKTKFLNHHPRWWPIIIHDIINNSNLEPEEILEGPLEPFFHMSPCRICTAYESKFSHPVIIPNVILAKLDEHSVSVRSYKKLHPGNYFVSQKEKEALRSCIQGVGKEEETIKLRSTAFYPISTRI